MHGSTPTIAAGLLPSLLAACATQAPVETAASSRLPQPPIAAKKPHAVVSPSGARNDGITP
ncbi:MAG: hypothetical protein NVS9B10_26190 [Nevskia sp.]